MRVTITLGALAEWIIGRLLKLRTDTPRPPYGDYDLVLDDKRIEVKAAAYLQAWDQKKLSTASVLPRRHLGRHRLTGRAGRALVRRLSVSARTDPLAAHAIRRCAGQALAPA